MLISLDHPHRFHCPRCFHGSIILSCCFWFPNSWNLQFHRCKRWVCLQFWFLKQLFVYIFVLTNSKIPIWKLWAVFPRCWCYSCIGLYTFCLGTLLGKIGYNIPKRLSTKGQRHKSTERLNMKLWYLLLWHTWLLFDRLEHWVYFVRKNYLLCNYTANRVKRKISTLPSGVNESN